MTQFPLDQSSSRTAKTLFSTWFTLADLTRARHEIEGVSREYGLDADELVDWITAINELMINAIRHGGGQGSVRLFVDDRFTCEVTDHGQGFDVARYVLRVERPPPSGAGGMGLWVVGQMADYLLVNSGPAGTTIRIAARTDRAGD